MGSQLNWINEDGTLVSKPSNGSEYGVVKEQEGYLAYYHPPDRIGGYLDHHLKIVAGFGAVCAIGPHPDTICQTEDEAMLRCQSHYDKETNND